MLKCSTEDTNGPLCIREQFFSYSINPWECQTNLKQLRFRDRGFATVFARRTLHNGIEPDKTSPYRKVNIVFTFARPRAIRHPSSELPTNSFVDIRRLLARAMQRKETKNKHFGMTAYGRIGKKITRM